MHKIIDINNHKNEILKSPEKFIVQKRLDTKPVVNFKFLGKGTSCFKEVEKKCTQKNQVLEDFQSFLFDFSNHKNITEAIKQYTSRKGSKLNKSKKYISNIINNFTDKNIIDKTYLNDTLIHVHLRKNGKGTPVLHGFVKDNMFYVLDFDYDHKFDK